MDDVADDLYLLRFPILGVDAVDADFRIGHDHDLSPIGGVSEHLLVTGHPGVEDQLAKRLPR